MLSTPCERCKVSKLACVIGSSNRGGRRVRHKRTLEQAGLSDDISTSKSKKTPKTPKTPRTQSVDQITFPSDHISPIKQPTGWRPAEYGSNNGIGTDVTPSTPSMMANPALQVADPDARENSLLANRATRESSAASGNIAFNDLQNPSDALGILAQIASHGENGTPYGTSQHGAPSNGFTQLEYPLVRHGRLSLSKIITLLKRYKYHYHPFFPIVPKETLDPDNLASTARDEPHLLTAILVIASRDLTDEPHVFIACSEHMRLLVSALAAGGSGNVEAVEALLLLAEWTPYTSRSDAGHVGRGEEDREAWMHVGMALRIGECRINSSMELADAPQVTSWVLIDTRSMFAEMMSRILNGSENV